MTFLQQLRKERGYTQQDLSSLSEVAISTIQKLESGVNDIRNANVSIVMALARVLNISVEELIKQSKKMKSDKERINMNNYESASNNYGTVVYKGKEYALTSQAEFEYRSHNTKGFQLTEPNNWMIATAIDTDGNEYTVWYYIDDEHINDEDMSDACDWENPSEVVAIIA